MSDISRKKNSKSILDIVIFIALPEELKVFNSMPPYSNFSYVKHGVFQHQFFNFKDRKNIQRKGAIVFINDMGERAKDAVYSILDQHRPIYVVSTGISAAVSADLNPGDIAISTSLSNPLAKSKFKSEGSGIDIQFSGDPVATDDLLAKSISSMWVSPDKKNDNQKLNKDSVSNLRHLLEKLSPENKRVAENVLLELPGQSSFKVVPGPTVAIPGVSASDALREKLKLRDRKIIALDMESGYIGDSLHIAFAERYSDHKPDFLSIRAISDFGDDNKNSFEESTKNILRSWASSNVAAFIRYLMHSFIDFDRQKKQSGRSHGSRSFQSEKDGIIEKGPHRFDVRRAFPSGYIKFDPLNIVVWDRRYAALVAQAPDLEVKKNPVSSVIAKTINRPTEKSEFWQLRGREGTGKSTYLDNLYFAAANQNQFLLPIHVDLEEMRRQLAEDDERANIVKIEEYFDAAIDGEKSKKILLLIDNALDDDLTHHSLTILRRKYLSDISLVIVATSEYAWKSYASFELWDAVIQLEAVKFPSPEANELISSFDEASEANIFDATKFGQLAERLSALQVKTVDPQIISIVLRYAKSDGAIAKAKNAVDLWMGWARIFLDKELDHSELPLAMKEVSLFAFLDYVDDRQAFSFQPKFERLFEKLLWSHTDVRGALIANFVLESISRVANRISKNYPSSSDKKSECRIRCLSMVFDKNLCQSIKFAVQSAKQVDLVNQVKVLITSQDLSLVPLAVYILGRMTEDFSKKISKEILQELARDSEDGFSSWKNSKNPNLSDFCRRAVYISLAYLNDVSAASKYIDEIFSNASAARMNRGFHLEYYEDTQSFPKRGLEGYLLADDASQPWSRTECVLRKSLDSSLSTKLSSRNLVELATYCSFVASRLEAGQIVGDGRTQHVEFLSRYLNVPHPLSAYVRALYAALRVPNTSVGMAFVFRGLYRLKHEPRVGWLEKQIGVHLRHATESVAAHTFGAALLAEILLTDDLRRRHGEFKKEDVIRFILLHDLGESIIGDRSPEEAGKDPTAERLAVDTLAGWSIFSGMEFLSKLRKYFSEFEAPSSVEARLARDFDCLDPVLQLCIYRKPDDPPETVDSFIRYYREKLQTSIGIELFEAILSEAKCWWKSEDYLGTIPPRSLGYNGLSK